MKAAALSGLVMVCVVVIVCDESSVLRLLVVIVTVVGVACCLFPSVVVLGVCWSRSVGISALGSKFHHSSLPGGSSGVIPPSAILWSYVGGLVSKKSGLVGGFYSWSTGGGVLEKAPLNFLST